MFKKYPIEFLNTPEGQLQIIRDFVPESKPDFDGKEDAFWFTVWNLYGRVCEGIKSFLLLYDHERFYEAFIIAGYVLETCAMLSYVKDEKTEETQKENYKKYIARASARMLIINLEASSDNLEKDIEWAVYSNLLKIFYPVGASIIKNSDNPKEKHEEIIKKINYRFGTTKEKIKLINNSYKLTNVQEYIKTFIANMDGVGKERFSRFYSKYCNYKHSNILDCIEGQFKDFQIEGVVYVLVLIVTYLNVAKLEPYQHSMVI